MQTLIGLLIPFIGTIIGSAMVIFMKNKINSLVEKLLLGFASGVMVAASIWSLILPSIEMSKTCIPAVVGFIIGIFFLLIINIIVSKINSNKNTSMMIFAITLHNIPEGMAVGVAYAAALSGVSGMVFPVAFALALGIAIQNIPEGAIISMPLKSKGYTKKKSFFVGVLSGIVEPIFALFTILLTNLVIPILPYLLSFAAGAMIYVVVKELVPEAKEDKYNLDIIFFMMGFIIMMVLDVILG